MTLRNETKKSRTPRLSDFFVSFLRDVIRANDKERVSAFDKLADAFGIGSDALEEAVDFVGVRLTPYLLIFGVFEELSISIDNPVS